MSKKLVVGAVLMLACGLVAAHDEIKPRSHPVRHAMEAPEMEAASAAGALALLVGGVIVLRGRKAAKKG